MPLVDIFTPGLPRFVNIYSTQPIFLLKNLLIIHEQNTKEINELNSTTDFLSQNNLKAKYQVKNGRIYSKVFGVAHKIRNSCCIKS